MSTEPESQWDEGPPVPEAPPGEEEDELGCLIVSLLLAVGLIGAGIWKFFGGS